MRERAAVLVRYPSAIIHADPVDAAATLARLSDALPVDVIDLRDRDRPSNDGLLATVKAALVLDVPDWLVASCPSLELIQTISTGVEWLDVALVRASGVRLANSAGTSAPEIAEFVVARILEHWKRLPELAALQRSTTWKACHGRSLLGARVVLIGYGPIGNEVARRLLPFGVRLTVVRQSWRQSVPGADDVLPLERLVEAVVDADAIVCAVPEALGTIGLLGDAVLRAAPRGVFVCNVGRGSAVVQADLLAALKDGHVGGAALDVVVSEPLPDDDPMWISEVRLSPHCSTVPSVAMERVVDLFIDNVRRVLEYRDLRNEIGVATAE